MNAVARLTLISLLAGLAACASPPRTTQPAPPVSAPTPSGTPSQPSSAPAPVPAKPMPRTSASFAPPPGGASHWDPGLGVYVLEEQPDTYYRQRTYYRWDNGWSWATSLRGPWEATDISGVPPGLGRLHR